MSVKLLPVKAGEKVSTLCMETDGSRSGYARRRAEQDGFTVDGEGFISRADVEAALVELGKRKPVSQRVRFVSAKETTRRQRRKLKISKR